MSLRSIFLVSGAVALIVGCGPRENDPETTGSTTGGAVTGTNLPTGGATGTATGGTATGGTATAYSCAAGPSATGPWGDGASSPHPIAGAGAATTNQPYTHEAGIQALVDLTTGNFDPTVVDATITGAIVIAVDYVPANPTDGTATFWFQDGSAVMQGYRLDMLGYDPTMLAPGDEITMRATSVQEYFGVPEVLAVDSFEVTSTGNDVYVVDGMTGDALDLGAHFMHNVEVYGELVSGPTTDCFANCFQMAYGSHTVVFRTDSVYDAEGDCIHYIGPLSEFGGAAQLNATSYDWYRWY
jgi:hypothetical protein